MKSVSAWLLPLCAAIAGAQSLRLDPPAIHLSGPGDSQRYLVTMIAADGSETDVTREAALHPSDAAVVQKDAGRLVGARPGEAEVAVEHAGLRAVTKVRVGTRSTGGQQTPVSFTRDVLSILTTKGCNSSSCHGSPAGQSGFKLSLFGSDSEADHRMIAAAHQGRRVDRANAANSLLLRKPSLAVAHGGGRLMSADSDEYRTVLNWLSQGAALDTGGARLEALEIYPSERILVGAGSIQPVAAIGRMSDGTTRDMTGDVRFSVIDTGVIGEPSGGSIAAKGQGLTTLMARAVGKTATAQFVVIGSRPGADYPAQAANNFIDTSVYAKLRQVNVVPYPLSGDAAFVRRVYLDAIGMLPSQEETHAFLVDARPNKRALLIDALLARPEYASRWMVKFEDWFRNSQFNSQGRTNASFKNWIHDFVEQDRPYSEVVRELLTSEGDTTVRPAGNFWHPAMDFMLKTFDVNKITPTVSRLFLGMRIECAECHNHPLENLTQDDFYGMAAFFSRLKVKHGYAQYRRVWYTEREGEVLHPVTKKPVAPKFLGAGRPPVEEAADRRAVLADWIVAQPQFARATVNRIWAEYFRTGIVDPYDDFRSTNRPTNPELLDQLARYFADSGYRFKALHRLILNSRVYQAASRAPGRAGQSAPLERALFARYEPRQLSAEILLDSVSQVTGVAHSFSGYPEGTSAKDLIATNGPDHFLGTFGFPRRDILAERAESPSLAQALLLMNNATVRGKVEDAGNAIGKLIESGLDDRAIVEALWRRGLSRVPSAAEWKSLESYMGSERDAGRSRRRVLENVLWVLLNSKEFRINQ